MGRYLGKDKQAEVKASCFQDIFTQHESICPNWSLVQSNSIQCRNCLWVVVCASLWPCDRCQPAQGSCQSTAGISSSTCDTQDDMCFRCWMAVQVWVIKWPLSVSSARYQLLEHLYFTLFIKGFNTLLGQLQATQVPWIAQILLEHSGTVYTPILHKVAWQKKAG